MHEIGIDRLEVVAMIERIEKLLAHAHQRGGAARREIEPAQQLLPARFRGGVNGGGGLVGGRGLPGGDGGIEPVAVRAEAVGQGLEKGDPRAGGQLGVFGEDVLRQCHAGRLATAGQQLARKAPPASPNAPPPRRGDRGCGRAGPGRAR